MLPQVTEAEWGGGGVRDKTKETANQEAVWVEAGAPYWTSITRSITFTWVPSR